MNTQQTTPLNVKTVRGLLSPTSTDSTITVAYYPGDEGAVASISPWFCSASSARLLFMGDNCVDCGDDLTADGEEDHSCEGDGPETIWLHLDEARLEAANLAVEQVAEWLDCGDPYESAARVASVLQAPA